MTLFEPHGIGRCFAIEVDFFSQDFINVHCTEKCHRLKSKTMLPIRNACKCENVHMYNGISDSVVCGIGRNSYFTGTDQKTGSEYEKELWD